ncbi:hypothetical protein IWX90DRAFT_513491 [Phyllosticta citrichinensis]|uniref:Deoxyribonuclease NucA/NucB domain-containing protein n=1 Tax=Phyllosticta citrichinensis TaxID=1130410 RepID=A0ABR1XSX5_9PEZI
MRLLRQVALLGSAGMALASSNALNRRTPPPNNPDDLMIFLCNEIPEICKNMCFGAYCQYIGERLRYDKLDSAEMARRSQAAGCGAPDDNRCAKSDPPLQCDQYPFLSTVSTKKKMPDRVSRCVPGDQNSKQSSIINAFYKSAYCRDRDGPCEFTVSFSNSGGVKHCEAYYDRSDCDKKEDIQVVGPGDEKIPKSEDPGPGIGGPEGPEGEPEQRMRARGDKQQSPPTQFKLDSGLEIFVPGGAFIGQRAFIVVALDQSLWDEQVRTHQPDPDLSADEFDYMLDNLQVIEFTVTEQIG